MKKSIYHLLFCLLIVFAWSGCKKKCDESLHASLVTDFIPYQTGNTFDMSTGSGRIVHFEVKSSVQKLYVDNSGSVELKCVPEAEALEAYVSSDSGTIAFYLYETAGSGSTVDDFRIDWQSMGGFYAFVSPTSVIQAAGTILTSEGSVAIGNRTYTDVWSFENNAALPDIRTKKVWYNNSAGLLKVEFTDSTAWTLVN